MKLEWLKLELKPRLSCNLEQLETVALPSRFYVPLSSTSQ